MVLLFGCISMDHYHLGNNMYHVLVEYVPRLDRVFDFCLNYVTNKGVAWGFFASYPLLLLIVRSLLVCLMAFYACFFSKGTLRQVSFLLIITGAVGNIFDYFYYGFVIDLFHFTLWGYSFPVFNVADSLIFLGIVAMMVISFTKKTTQILNYEGSDQ